MVNDLTELFGLYSALVAGNVAYDHQTKTADYVVTSSDLYGTKIFDNNGASGTVNFTLPATPASGHRASFEVVTAQLLKVTAAGSKTIRYKSQQTSANGYVQSNAVGDFWSMEYNGTEWVIDKLIGDLTHAAGNFGDAYDYIMIPAAAFEPCTTAGCGSGIYEYGTNDIDRYYLAFDGGATEERAQSPPFILDEDWDLSTVKCRADWSSATGSTAGDTVEFGFKLGAFSDSDPLDAALGTVQVISDTLLVDNGGDRQLSGATPAITVGGTPAARDQIVLEILRNTDGTDDMAEDAWVFGVWLQFKKTKSNPAW
jgi:hypothetical protein